MYDADESRNQLDLNVVAATLANIFNELLRNEKARKVAF